MNDNLFICPKCNGYVIITPNQTLAHCPTCDSLIPLPQVAKLDENNEWNDLDKALIAKYNRANQYNMKLEFHRAYNLFEKISQIKPDDYYPYWGKLLAQYGVTYIVRPDVEPELVCLRTRFENVLQNVNYLKALTKADDNTQVIMKREAQKINALVQKIIDNTMSFDCYDAMICYADTNSNAHLAAEEAVVEQLTTALEASQKRVWTTKGIWNEDDGKSSELVVYPALIKSKMMIVVASSLAGIEDALLRNIWVRYWNEIRANNRLNNSLVFVFTEEVDFANSNIKADWLALPHYTVTDINTLLPEIEQHFQTITDWLATDVVYHHDKIVEMLQKHQYSYVATEAKLALNKQIEDAELWWLCLLAKNEVSSGEALAKLSRNFLNDQFFERAFIFAPYHIRMNYLHWIQTAYDNYQAETLPPAPTIYVASDDPNRVQVLDDETYDAEVAQAHDKIYRQFLKKCSITFVVLLAYTCLAFMTLSFGTPLGIIISLLGFATILYFIVRECSNAIAKHKNQINFVSTEASEKYYKELKRVLKPEQSAPYFPSHHQKPMFIIATVFLCVAVSMTLSFAVKEIVVKAQNSSINYYYFFDEVTITGGNGTKVDIPTTVDGRYVRKVAEKAFYNDQDLVEVWIDTGLVTIAEDAFADCQNLQRVTVPLSVEQVYGTPFSGCNNLLDFNYHGKINRGAFLGGDYREQMPKLGS